jgi:hypothetical protein
MIFLYGELDPWSAEKFKPSSKDSHLFVAPGGNHRSTITSLSATDRATVAGLLSRWLSVSVAVPRAAPAGARLPPFERSERGGGPDGSPGGAVGGAPDGLDEELGRLHPPL